MSEKSRRAALNKPLTPPLTPSCPNRRCPSYRRNPAHGVLLYGAYGSQRTTRFFCRTCRTTFSIRHMFPSLLGSRLSVEQWIVILGWPIEEAKLGNRLPTVRDIASKSGVNKNTVLRVRKLAEKEPSDVYLFLHTGWRNLPKPLLPILRLVLADMKADAGAQWLELHPGTSLKDAIRSIRKIAGT